MATVQKTDGTSRTTVMTGLAVYDYARVFGNRQALVSLKSMGIRSETFRQAARDLLALAHQTPNSPLAEMLERDLHPPSSDRAVRSWARRLGLLARAQGLAAPAAALRLLDLCRQSLTAGEQRPWNRMRNDSFCWAGLWPALPESMSLRIWPTKRQAVDALDGIAKRAGSGLHAPLGSRIRIWRDQARRAWVAQHSEAPLPKHLPFVGHAPAPIFSQVVGFHAGRLTWHGHTAGMLKMELRPLITKLIQASPRRHLTIAAPADTLWSDSWPLIRAAVYSGFESVGLAVSVGSTGPSSAAGPGHRSIPLMGEFPISLRALAPWPKGPRLQHPVCAPRRPVVLWPPQAEHRALTIQIARDGLRIATDGVCSPNIPFPPQSPKTGTRHDHQPDPLAARIAQIFRSRTGRRIVLIQVQPDTSLALLVHVLSMLHETTKKRSGRILVGLRKDWPACSNEPDKAQEGDQQIPSPESQ